MSRCIGILAAGILAANAFASASLAQTLKREPPMGKLQERQRILVDDGSCGPGKIKEVIGGNHVKVGGTKQIERIRRCIPKN